jgi:hypothetical protein
LNGTYDLWDGFSGGISDGAPLDYTRRAPV